MARIVRTLVWVLGVAVVLLATCAVLPFALFSISGQDEVARVPSPDEAVDAVVVETNGGATTSFGYRVILTRHDWHWRTGREAADLYGALRSERAYGVNLDWEDDSTLSVFYLSARQASEPHRTLTIAGRAITTTLRDGVSDPEAPPGGMLYNLQSRSDDQAGQPTRPLPASGSGRPF